MTDSHGVVIPFCGNIITFDSGESRKHIDTVMESLEGHVVAWSIKRPGGNTIELLGPGAVSLGADGVMGFMILRTPSRVKAPRWILWIGRPDEADGFIRNARKRSAIDGYKLIQKPYRFTADPETN